MYSGKTSKLTRTTQRHGHGREQTQGEGARERPITGVFTREPGSDSKRVLSSSSFHLTRRVRHSGVSKCSMTCNSMHRIAVLLCVLKSAARVLVRLISHGDPRSASEKKAAASPPLMEPIAGDPLYSRLFFSSSVWIFRGAEGLMTLGTYK